MLLALRCQSLLGHSWRPEVGGRRREKAHPPQTSGLLKQPRRGWHRRAILLPGRVDVSLGSVHSQYALELIKKNQYLKNIPRCNIYWDLFPWVRSAWGVCLSCVRIVVLMFCAAVVKATQQICVDRSEAGSKDSAVDQLTDRARDNRWPHLFIFPEGVGDLTVVAWCDSNWMNSIGLCTNRKSLVTFKRGGWWQCNSL